MKILKYPDPFLFKKVDKVENFDDQLKKETIDMLNIMRLSKGVGLAANQVGLNKRIFVMECSKDKDEYVFINPEIINYTEEEMLNEEGCLSFPDLYIGLNRKKEVELQWQDIKGNIKKEWFKEIESICVQHELDHLNGVVFVNRLKPTKKQLVINKYMKKK